MNLFFLLIILYELDHIVTACKKLDQYCFCDEICVLYGDCCPDHKDYEKIKSSPSLSTCKPLSQTIYTKLIDKCPDNNHRLADFCTKTKYVSKNYLHSMIPVISKSGEVYENLFCAQCNNKKQFSFFNITVQCTENQPTSIEVINALFENNSACTYMISMPKYALRRCFENLIRKCPKFDNSSYINKTIIDYCEKEELNNTLVFMSGEEYYRNEYCCQCWNKTCFPFDVLNKAVIGGFTYMLNFNEWEKDNLESKSNLTSQGSSISNDVIYYISIIFSVLSISSLLILIVIYLKKKIFHTFGGYLTICLSSFMLLMTILPLIQLKRSTSTAFFCKFLAIVKHYVGLSTFTWMSIYALDLVQTFAFGSVKRNNKKSFRTFIFYCGISFGFVTFFVGSAIVLENISNKNSTLNPNYGGENCFFTSKYGGMIWYFIPTCILLTWNFISCVIVFYKLSKTAKECRVVKQTDSNNTVGLCIRLTAVFGIGYVFQVVSVLLQYDMMIAIGSLVNCLQGCFLATCFLATKRVHMVITSTFSSIQILKSKQTNVQIQSTRVTLLSNGKLELNQM